jgi:preprotein translocase subunit SecF
MASKNWWVVVWVVVIACLLVIAAYHAGKVAGKFAGENSAEFRLREKELAFQKEKEATRKAEFAKLLRIYEEEKRANEKRRRHEKMEELDKEAAKRLKESQDRQMALYMRAIEMLMQNRHPQF